MIWGGGGGGDGQLLVSIKDGIQAQECTVPERASITKGLGGMHDLGVIRAEEDLTRGGMQGPSMK